MKKTGKRILAVCIALILCCMPMQALAADNTVTWRYHPGGNFGWDTFKYLGEWEIGETINLSDFEPFTCYSITAEKAGVYSMPTALSVSDQLKADNPYGYKDEVWITTENGTRALVYLDEGETEYICCTNEYAKGKDTLTYFGNITGIRRANDKLLTSASFTSVAYFPEQYISSADKYRIVQTDYIAAFDNGQETELGNLYISPADFSEKGVIRFFATVLGKTFQLEEKGYMLKDIVESVELYDGDQRVTELGKVFYDGTVDYSDLNLTDQYTLRFRFNALADYAVASNMEPGIVKEIQCDSVETFRVGMRFGYDFVEGESEKDLYVYDARSFQMKVCEAENANIVANTGHYFHKLTETIRNYGISPDTAVHCSVETVKFILGILQSFMDIL